MPDLNISEILIVDDDTKYLSFMEGFLRAKGINAIYANSGEEAILEINKGRFAFMITDLNMTGMDGIELSIKARELAPDIKIIMVTGDASHETLDRAEKAGIAEVFCKPFDPDAVLANFLT